MQLAAKKVKEIFTLNKWTLCLAESCTGGLVSSALVSIPDASLFFLGSVVAYSNKAKKELLSVSSKTLDSFGAVSEETALEMALGALKHFHSDFALSVTGIAGPTGGSLEKPIGTVSFALVSQKRGKILTTTFHFKGERTLIMESACREALNTLALASSHRL